MKTYEEWAAYYRPMTNHFVETASFDGVMFETYGKELEYVNGFPYNRVWTYISDVDGDRIEPGMRIVDRLGYFLTGEPWLEEEYEIFDLGLDTEDED
jgi:hypothetical protein